MIVLALANSLAGIGVEVGDMVAVMDGQSSLPQCYFTLPMVGTILQTVNLRLSPAQLVYTLTDTGVSTLLVNTEFLPLVEKLADRLPRIRRIVPLNDMPTLPRTPLVVEGEFESLLTGSSPDYDFPDFDENSWATAFHTSGTTGAPKSLSFSHRQCPCPRAVAFTPPR
jgi:fatty-acyl-CoA synthase